MKSIQSFDFKGHRAIVRVDFNVPLSDKLVVSDDTRIRAALPTIEKITNDGGIAILMSHLGRPKGGPEKKYSMEPVANRLSEILDRPVYFVDDCVGEKVQKRIDELSEGDILILENLRFYGEEEKGNPEFAGELAKLADVYVNDAFGTAHRAHASTAVIAKFFPENKMFGYLMEAELSSVRKVMESYEKPFTAIIGGAKVSTKIGIIENLFDKIDNLIIGGGMTYTFVKAQGGEIGSSLVEDDFINKAKEILQIAEEKGVRILLPEDSVIADEFSNDAQRLQCASDEIPEGWMGLDIGEDAIEEYAMCIRESRTILWNGPAGVFEFSNFENGTKSVANAIVQATEAGAFSLIGGGDSVAAINKYGLTDHVSYVSTGGGALLELIEGKDLPGVKAVRE